MENLNKLTWSSLIIEAIVLLLIQNSIAMFEQDIMPGISDVVQLLMPILWISFSIQVLSAILFVAGRAQSGRICAWIGGLMMLPLGYIYIEGARYTFYNIKYSAFTGGTVSGPMLNSFPFKPSVTSFSTGGGLAAGGMAIFLFGSFSSLGAMLLILGVVSMARASRMQKKNFAEFYPDSLRVTPGVHCPTILLPYANIQCVTPDRNHNPSKLILQVRTPILKSKDEQSITIPIALLMLEEPAQQDFAIELLANLPGNIKTEL